MLKRIPNAGAKPFKGLVTIMESSPETTLPPHDRIRQLEGTITLLKEQVGGFKNGQILWVLAVILTIVAAIIVYVRLSNYNDRLLEENSRLRKTTERVMKSNEELANTVSDMLLSEAGPPITPGTDIFCVKNYDGGHICSIFSPDEDYDGNFQRLETPRWVFDPHCITSAIKYAHTTKQRCHGQYTKRTIPPGTMQRVLTKRNDDPFEYAVILQPR